MPGLLKLCGGRPGSEFESSIVNSGLNWGPENHAPRTGARPYMADLTGNHLHAGHH
jgi:hypothetical protein